MSPLSGGSMKKIGVAGSVCLDINPIFKANQNNWLEEGKQTDLEDINITLGGCVGNTGLALSSLDVPVRVFCKVGDDKLGAFVYEILKASGVDSIIEHTTDKSSASIIIAPPKKDRTILHKSGASQSITPDDIPDEFFSSIDLFHFGYPPKMTNLWKNHGSGMAKLLERAKSKGVATSLDMCMTDDKEGDAALASFLPFTDIFLPSYEEMLRLINVQEYKRVNAIANGHNLIEYIADETISEIADWILSQGVHIVLLKLGKKGLYLKTDDKASSISGLELGEEWNSRELWIAPKEIVAPVSTIGAGDTAIAGFLASLASSFSPDLALSVASCTAAKCIESTDRGHSMQKLSAIKLLAESEYSQESLSIALNGWTRRDMVFYGPSDK